MCFYCILYVPIHPLKAKNTNVIKKKRFFLFYCKSFKLCTSLKKIWCSKLFDICLVNTNLFKLDSDTSIRLIRQSFEPIVYRTISIKILGQGIFDKSRMVKSGLEPATSGQHVSYSDPLPHVAPNNVVFAFVKKCMYICTHSCYTENNFACSLTLDVAKNDF